MSINENIKKINLKTISLAALILIALYIIVVGVLIYGFGARFSENKIALKTAAIVPYPAAIVGTNFITFAKVMNELASVRSFYMNQDFSNIGLRVDFSTPEGKKRLEIKKKNILGKLIEDSIIQSEAEKRGIKLTDNDIKREVDGTLQQYGNVDDLKKNLSKLYGWTIADFERNIVKPDLYKEKLFENLRTNDPSYAAAKDKISEAQNELKNRTSFSEVASRYSDGESAKNGGELGWFSADQMLPEVAVPVMALNSGDTSEIIKSSIGYHIVRVEDKKTENNVPMVKISQIFVRTRTFSDWLSEAEKNKKIFIPIQEFKWNSSSGQVEFTDKSLSDFENNLPQNSPDDASVMF